MDITVCVCGEVWEEKKEEQKLCYVLFCFIEEYGEYTFLF